MVAWFARTVTRRWVLVLGAWLALWAGTLVTAPTWRATARDGEFQFLPRGSQSRLGEHLLRRAFPGRITGSSVVIVVTRIGDEKPLSARDLQFIAKTVRPGLEQIAKHTDESTESRTQSSSSGHPTITRVMTFEDKEAGPLLVSEDGRASLVLVEMTTDFMLRRNIPVIDRIEEFLTRLEREGAVPSGLKLDLSGSAVLGRDMIKAESESARAIQRWTVGLVIVLLLVFYRAPLIALIPLVTLYAAMGVSIRLLLLMAKAGYIELFRGLDVYATVVAYAAGVDYNLFLISRYQEELRSNDNAGSALELGMTRIAGALAASAATVICGIGTLMFASFGKFRQAGFGIAFSLAVMLCATMTLTPALLRAAGRFAFWPSRLELRSRAGGTYASGWRAWLFASKGPFERLWGSVGSMLQRRPGTIWLATVIVLSPLAGVGIWNYDNVNYGLIQGLPKSAPSVRGTRALTRHYPAGDSGPLTLVLRNDRIDFAQNDGLGLVRQFVERLEKRRRALKIADIRSVVQPLGISPAAQKALPTNSAFLSAVAQPLVVGRATEHYVSDTRELDHHVIRLDLVLDVDPYTRASISQLDVLETAIRTELPRRLQEGTETYLVGATSSFRDLKVVAERDRKRINLLVTISVLTVLIVLLRRVAVPIFLIVSVLFGYLVTLGATHLTFRLMEGPGFAGLDWTVPFFLFTLLIAVGEDYNIILVTRIDEEQARHGPIDGIVQALGRTGGIISGCGFIMAGTFSSLAFGGSLARMYQLGFALTLGVLLDTFIVRPVLVPGYMILVNRLRFPALGRILGAMPHAKPEPGMSSRSMSSHGDDGATAEQTLDEASVSGGGAAVGDEDLAGDERRFV
jgi:RND superfamily putative drug exporter